MSDRIAHELGAITDRVELHEHGHHAGVILHQPHAHLGGHAEHALAADKGAPQVEPKRLGFLTAENSQRSIGQHHLEPHDVGARHPIGQAVRTAGVVGDVATDRAGLLATRIGGEMHPKVSDLLRQIEI